MKHPIAAASTLAIALAVGGSVAFAENYQQTQNQPGQASQSAGMGQQSAQTSGQQGGMTQKRVDQIDGMAVVNRQGNQIGEVNKVVRSNQDNQPYAVVSSGGFFDIGDKEIAVPLNQLRLQNDKLVLPESLGTKTALKSQPSWDDSKYQEISDSQQVDLERASFAAFESQGGSQGQGQSSQGQYQTQPQGQSQGQPQGQHQTQPQGQSGSGM
jgi:sporulation protein YlmC with PRC-barrel domain